MIHTIDVPRPVGGEFNPASHRIRRRQLDALGALMALGEPCAHRLVMADGSPVPADQVTDQDLADVVGDLERIGRRDVPSLDVLLELLYAVSSHSDRSRVASALDRLLEYVDHWSATAPEHVVALFERLDPARTVRAVGQTLLAATRMSRDHLPARQAFLERFLADLRARGTPETTIRRLEQGLET